MTQEEKAKAYDEAIIKAKALYGQPLVDNTLLETIFPELAESEDERMRTGLINGFKECLKNSNYPKNAQKYWHGIAIEDIFAWLEKQGEYKSPEEVFKIRQELYQSGYNDGYKHGYEDTKKLKKIEEKPKWSEEDEHHWMMCLECVEECASQEREDFSKTIDWLKSIKQRMEE